MSAVLVPALADCPGPEGRRWADLRTRTLSAVVLGPAVLVTIWFGGPVWAGLAAGAGAGLMGEWSQMCGHRNRAGTLALMVAGTTAAVCATGAAYGWALVALLVGAGLAWGLSRRVALAAGALYIGLPLLCLIALRGNDTTGRDSLLFVVAIVWASDIGAYVTGRLLGGPKLAAAISPGKTWSGAAGGLAAAMLVGELAAYTLGAPAPLHTAMVAAILGIASQSGDLLESGIKRHFGVKDSGSLIPGHGGLLDRLDGLLASATAATLLINTGIISPGGALWT